ncbi:MAG: Tol-Pal system beta propeller repeat protein TolB [Deltaproteobacteria bacterium]|nr:Tol-Pal system beta propeller repeat protein TolB [Deltaproteobacteria bacterium]
MRRLSLQVVSTGRFVLAIALVAFASLASASAQVRGTIVGPSKNNYPIAISPLKNLSAAGGKDIGAQFADIVARDLTLAGLFKVLDRTAYIEKPDASGINAEDINFDNWSVIGALALVKGGYTVEGDNLTIEAKLFDVYQRKQLAGKRYRGGMDLVRRMAHRFADEIMAQFTGERGPFDSRIAFVSTRDGRFKEVYVMSLDGGDLQQVTKSQSITVSPSWTPDARSLLFTSYKRGNPDLYQLDLISGRETRISQRAGLNLGGKMSPDGSTIAMALETDGSSDVVILDRSGELVRRATDNWAIDVSPSWSPDGRQLAFCSNRGGGPQIFITSAEGGAARRITSTGDYNTAPAWSPKGDRIAYVSRSEGAFDIFTVKTDGSEPRQLTQGSGNNEDPSWSPDGRYILFSSSRRGHKKLFITDVGGVSQVELTQGGGDDTSPTWSGWRE